MKEGVRFEGDQSFIWYIALFPHERVSVVSMDRSLISHQVDQRALLAPEALSSFMVLAVVVDVVVLLVIANKPDKSVQPIRTGSYMSSLCNAEPPVELHMIFRHVSQFEIRNLRRSRWGIQPPQVASHPHC